MALAKRGFTQSYTYFTWRTEKSELQAYFEEITKPPVSDFFTPNLWPNTPDILHASLQTGGRAAFQQRLILATTLAASYGIYGPAFELGENVPLRPGSEEYLNSEKYQIRHWDRRDPNSLAPLITLLNQIRRTNPALQSDLSLHFHPVDNPQIIAYSKSAPATAPSSEAVAERARIGVGGAPRYRVEDVSPPANVILVVVNLDPHNEQAGWVDLDLKQLGIATTRPSKSKTCSPASTTSGTTAATTSPSAPAPPPTSSASPARGQSSLCSPKSRSRARPQSTRPPGRYCPAAAGSAELQTHTTPRPRSRTGHQVAQRHAPRARAIAPSSSGRTRRPQSPSPASTRPAWCSRPAPSAPAQRSSGT